MPTRPARTIADGVDLSQRIRSAADLRAAGKTFAVRYVSPNTAAHPQKRLTAAELADCLAHGVAVAVVWETTENRATAGRAAGVDDAAAAAAVARSLGLDPMPIHWAIDFDATGLQVDAYARGWVDVLGVERCGAYGGIRPLAYLLDRHLITYAWQAFAWSNGQIEPRATAYQWRNDVTVAGNNVDLDAALAHDFGQWPRPTNPGDGELDMALTDDDVAKIWAYPLLNSVTGQNAPAGAYLRSLNTQVNDLDTVKLPAVLAAETAEAATLAGLPAATAQALATVLPPDGGAAGLSAKQQADSLRAAADLLDPPAAGG